MGLFWARHYPDGGGATFTIPAVAASLALADPVTVSGALEYVVIRARAQGAAGNGVRFRMQTGTLSDFGELVEENSDCTVLFNDGDRVGDIINLINAQSTLVEAVGTWNPNDLLIEGEDDFEFYDLEHGVDAQVGTRSLFWGPHYPDAAHSEPLTTYRAGSGPDGVATFALDLESGATVAYHYMTDVLKVRTGAERRAALLDDPPQAFNGSAHLVGERALAVRDHLYRYAALGSTFLLALPYEEITVTGEAVDRVIPVTDTSLSDWANVSQRVVVVDGEGGSVEGVIQSVTATSIELDVAPGNVAGPGSRVMPLVAVILEPQQGFTRFPIARDAAMPDVEQVETWQIAARLAVSGFLIAPQPGELRLVDVVGAGFLEGVIWRATYPGVSVGVQLEVGGALEVTFGVTADEDGNYNVFIETPTNCTVGELYEAIQSSGLLTMVGEWNDADILDSSYDFALTALEGALAGGPVEVGRGVTVTEFDDRPIFDAGGDVEGTAPESMQSLSVVVDIGPIPYSVKRASRADWGRSVVIKDRPTRVFWQWFKKFVDTVRGRQRAFWLPTYREDLRAVSDGPGGGTTGQIVVDEFYGDFELWYATHDHLMVEQGDDTYYVTITGVTDNANGTLTLDVDTGGPTIPDAAPITKLSWLELCRFEDDRFAVELRDANFTVKTQARVVQQ